MFTGLESRRHEEIAKASGINTSSKIFGEAC